MQFCAYPIVGIGASAGGLEAFHGFFERMPADCGMAFVLILHLPADRKSMLAQIVARWTGMPVVEAVNGTPINANCVYIPPPRTVVTIADDRLALCTRPVDDAKLFRPIDTFFDSLGTAIGPRSVGIVLSGTGSDGALGLKAIKERGGLTLAQGTDGDRPQYGEMPAGAIATGAVDLIAPVSEMPAHLLRMRGNRLSALESPHESAQHIDEMRLRICAILRTQIGHDFSGYRDKTFLRRVQRRMQVVNVETLAEYEAHLRRDHEEVRALFRDLLISVTSFFRDKDTFDVLEQLVIPRLFANKGADSSVRVWTAGCATGEEAYSLAILLREHMDTLVAVPKVQIFATDIDEVAIDTARLGRYPSTLLDGLSEERQKRFFRPSRGSFAVVKEIRDLCTFSTHNLLRDPPFSRMDMVSCRNLLIYLDTALQSAVIPIFHYSLSPGGILLLGGSESTSRHGDLFEPLDKPHRIYLRRATKSPPLRLQDHELDLIAYTARSSTAAEGTVAERPTGAAGTLSRKFLAGRQAMPNPQNPDHAASRGSGTKMDGGFGALVARLWPFHSRVRQLGRDLDLTQEALDSLREEHQTALEELRSANEELHSVNEEMQSTNEELETSKEELQSVNEELHTVNARLTEKVDELDATNSDLRNLFESTQIATVFLDRHLIIRSFTPAIASIYNLIPSDQGRSLGDIVTHLEYDTLREDVGQVLSTLQPLERRIARADRTAHYIMRILPYRQPDSTVSGALVTFVDVTNIVHAEDALRDADMRKDLFIATLSHELRNPLAPIRTAAAILAAPNVAPEQMTLARSIIARQVLHLTTLLDDLLDVSRIARGSVMLKRAPVALTTIFADAIESVRAMVDRKSQQLTIEGPLPETVLHVDPVRMTQVLVNLLSNASKYTQPHGTLKVSASADDQSVTLIVRDNGIGIAPSMLPVIFQMFSRADQPMNRTEQGLGVGLALAKGLVELHGGSIAVRSEGLGLGSEFVVTLPASALVPASQGDGAGASTAYAPVQRGHSRILIADDNPDGAESLRIALNLSGFEVFVAPTAAEALSLAERLRPDVAVLDVGMPGLSGYELARRIRSQPWGQNLPLIAVTGWGQEGDRRAAKMAGFDHHLTKPVDPAKLIELVAQSTG